MVTLVSRRTKRAIKRKDHKLSTTNYATKWAGITQDAPSGVTGSTATRYKSNSSSVSSVAIAPSGTVSFTIETGEGYVAGDHIMVIPASQPTYYMSGNVTAHNSGTGAISFNVTASNGTGTFNSWSLGGTIPDGRNYFGLIKFAGTDSETGFVLPTGAPLYANTSTEFGIQFIDWYDGFLTNDAAGFAASASTDFEQVTIDGVTTTALVIDQKQPVAPIDPVGGYRKQTWAMLYRDVATDLPRLLTSYDLWINDLTGKLSTTNRRVNIWEKKTLNDFRYVCTIIMADATDATEFGVAVGTIGWEIVCDNRAASLTVEEFFRYKNFTTPVPTEEFVKFIVFWVRGSYTDETKGRLLIQYKPSDSDDFLTVCDYNYQSNIGYNSAHPLQAVGNSPATDNRNIHMGVNGGAPQRIFFCGVYGKYEQTSFKVKCANLEFHDNYLPPTLASAAVILGILHGPYSYIPTVPTGVVKFVSPTGTGVGTFTDPMSIADANDGALPGDHYWLRGGTYTIPLNGIRFYSGGTSWESGKYVTYESYPGEQAVFDGAANQAEEADVRVKFQNAFVCLRKVEIKNCSLQGVEMSGTDNKIEFCEIHDCWLSGITAAVSGGTASWPYANGRNIIRSNTIYNCSDVGHLTGSYANGGNADAISISSGISNIVEYNRCYNCSDDGIDVWRSTSSIVRYNLVYSCGLGDGNGNGLKCGGSPSGTTYSTDHIFAYNISVGNKSSGFAGNNGVRTYLYHNTTALNAEGFTDFDSTTRLVGNIAAETTRYTGSTAGHSSNSWNVAAGTTPTFISTDPSSSDYYKPPAGNVFEGIGAYTGAREAVLSYNDATFYAPLQTSLLLTNGSGYGSFARSSAKWMLNSNLVLEEFSANIPTYHAEYGLHLNSAAVTSDMLYCRDFTNAAWVKTNVTAARSTDALIKHTRIAYLDTVTSSASPSSIDLDLSTYSQTYTYNSMLTSATATGASVNTYTLPSLGRYASPGGVPRIPFIISDIGTPGNAVVDKTAAVAFRDENLPIWNTNTYYVKPSTGSNSNAGTLAAPFATLTHAVRTATAGSTILCLEDFVEQPFDIRSTDASQTSQQAKLIDANGYNVIIRTSGSDLTTQTYVVDGTYTNCYKTTLSLSAGQALTRVLDTSTNDAYGYSTPFYMYASAAALDVASGNGVYWDNAGRVLWVKIGAGTNVESQKSILKGLYSSSASTSRILIYGSAIGFSGVRFEGVQFVQLDQGSRLPQLWLHNCVQLWALDKGFDGTNCGRYIATNTIVYSSKADGANAFATSAVGKGLIVTVNCQYIRNGDIRVYAHNGTLQGISAHGGSDHVSIGSVFALNNGQGVADTGGTSTADYTWLVGCSFTGGDTTAKNLTFQGTSFLGCSLLTATASNGTVLQTITAAAAAGCTGFYVKRSVGTGTIEITRDNGTTWLDIAPQLETGSFTLVKVENTSVTNPVVGFRFGTSGDAIIVDCGINHLGTKIALPILTTSASVTVAAETLTYPTSGNFSDIAGTIMATVQQDTWAAGGVVGSATHGLFANTATSGAQAKDGTNTASGETGTPTGSVKLGCRWSGSSLEAFSATTYLSVGAAASYDGSFNLSTISVGVGVAGYVKDVAIYV